MSNTTDSISDVATKDHLHCRIFNKIGYRIPIKQ